MMASRDVRVAIIGDPSSLQRALRTSETATASFATRMDALGSRLRNAGSTLTRGLTLPLVGLGVVAYRELSASQAALAQTEAVIESTGGTARKSVGDIEELVMGMRDLSGLDDEGLQEMANTLLTFRGIVGPVFDEAFEATTNLSVAMDRDLRSSAVMVGRALNDPVRGMSALTRVGVQFSDEQRAAIETMVAFGDTAGAQRLILAELNAEFGGSAEALGGTFQGRMNVVRQKFEDMAAMILEDLLPVIEDLVGHIERLSNAYSDMDEDQQKWVAGFALAALVIGPVTSALGFLIGIIKGVALAFGALGGGASAVILGLIGIGLGIAYIATHWQETKDFANTAFDNIVNNAPGARAVVGELARAVEGVRRAFNAAKGAASSLWTAAQRINSVVMGEVTGAVNTLAGALRSALTSAQSLLETLIQIGQQNLDKVSGPGVIPRGGTGSGAGGSTGGRSRGPVRESGNSMAEMIGRSVARELARTPQPVIVQGSY
jgi:hypothetical protein